MRSLDDVFAGLNRSAFHRKFHLRAQEQVLQQHATACCCRRCLEKFHGIPTGRAVTAAQQDHVIAVLECWLRAEEAQLFTEQSMAEGG